MSGGVRGRAGDLRLRALRRLLITIVVLVVLFVAADRVSLHEAQSLVAQRIRTVEALPRTPQVSISGFPFLSQAFSGDYRQVSVTMHGLRRGLLVISTVQATLTGVHLPLSELVHGRVSTVPVDSATGTLSVSYQALDGALKGLTVVYAGRPGYVVVRSSQFPASATARLQVSGNQLTTDIQEVNILGLSIPGLDLNFQVPLGVLPFGVHLTGVTASAGGVSLSAAGRNLQLTGG